MKTKIGLTGCMLLLAAATFAQKASDVLEDGIRCRKGKIYFQQEISRNKKDRGKKIIKYSKSGKENSFHPWEDSSILLVNKNHAIFVEALNPISYNYTDTAIFYADPIIEQALKELHRIIDIGVQAMNTKNFSDSLQKMNFFEDEEDPTFLQELMKIQGLVRALDNENVWKDFKTLKKLTFLKEKDTKDSIRQLITKNTEDISKLEELGVAMHKMDSLISKGLDDEEYFSLEWYRYFAADIQLQKFEALKSSYKIQLDHLAEALHFVDQSIKSWHSDASKDKNNNDRKWYIEAEEVSLKQGKMASYNFKLYSSGFELGNAGIVSAPRKELHAWSCYARRFNWFVPEVAVGVFYTDLHYPTYGTTTNENGEMVLGSAGEEDISRVNATAAINFTLNMPNSIVLPFWQLGAGINKEVVPILFTGVGLRINMDGLSRFAFSTGIAMSWIQELDKLRVGDKITGTTDIKNDLKYTFSWPPKPYVGIQWNF